MDGDIEDERDEQNLVILNENLNEDLNGKLNGKLNGHSEIDRLKLRQMHEKSVENVVQNATD